MNEPDENAHIQYNKNFCHISSLGFGGQET